MAGGVGVPELLERSASSESWVAFLDRQGAATRLAFEDLWLESRRAGRELTRRCGRRGAVAMILGSSPACVASLFGAWTAGLTVASLPLPARGAPIEEYLAQVRETCRLVGAELLLLEPEVLALVPEVGGLTAVAFDEVVRGDARLVADTGGEFVQFTGGSTAAPKGVRLSLEAVAANVVSLLGRVEPRGTDVGCSWLPLSHDMGLIGMCLTIICGFGSPWGISGLVLMPPESFLASPLRWLRMCDEWRGTISCVPNFAFELCARRIKPTTDLDLSQLRMVTTGAEPVRATTLRRFAEATQTLGFRPEAISPAYGLAEATLAVTMVPGPCHWASRTVDSHEMGAGRWIEADDGVEVISCGPTLEAMRVRVDPDGDADVGLLEIAGPSLLSEYLGDATPDWHDGHLRTNDLGAVVDGELFVLGRVDDVIVVAGRNLYATELETVAAGNDMIRAGNCAVVSDDEGRYLVVAEPSRNATGDALAQAATEIRTDLSRRFGVGPTSIVFVERRSLPKTPSGKLRRNHLRRALECEALPVLHAVRFGRQAVGAG